MLRKLVLLAVSSGLIKKIYDTYKAKKAEASVQSSSTPPMAPKSRVGAGNAHDI